MQQNNDEVCPNAVMHRSDDLADYNIIQRNKKCYLQSLILQFSSKQKLGK